MVFTEIILEKKAYGKTQICWITIHSILTKTLTPLHIISPFHCHHGINYCMHSNTGKVIEWRKCLVPLSQSTEIGALLIFHVLSYFILISSDMIMMFRQQWNPYKFSFRIAPQFESWISWDLFPFSSTSVMCQGPGASGWRYESIIMTYSSNNILGIQWHTSHG